MQAMQHSFPGMITVQHCASTVYAVICLSVNPSQAGTESKRLDKSSQFFACRLPSIYPTLCYNKILVSLKLGHFSLELCPKLRT